MKKISAYGSLFLALIIGSGVTLATPVMFPLSAMFGGGNYNRQFRVDSVRPLLTDNTSLYVGSFLLVTPTGGTNPIVQLTPNDYLVTFQDARTPWRISVPNTNVVQNALRLTSTNTVLPTYVYVPWPTNYVNITTYQTNFVLTLQTNVVSVTNALTVTLQTNYAWVFYQAYTNTTLVTNTVNLTNTVNVTNTVNTTNSFNVTNGISGGGFTGTIVNLASVANTNLVAISGGTNYPPQILTFGDATAFGYGFYSADNSLFLQDQGDGTFLFVTFNGSMPHSFGVFTGWLGETMTFTDGSSHTVSFFADYVATHYNLTTFSNGVCTTNIFQ